jgi:hypothetical protein
MKTMAMEIGIVCCSSPHNTNGKGTPKMKNTKKTPNLLT